MDGLPCADAAEAVGEPLAGTAARARVFVLLEHRGGWDPKPLPGLDVPIPVRERLLALDARDDTRVQLVRTPGSDMTGPGLHVAVADPVSPRLVEVSLSRFEDLLDVDIDGIVAGTSDQGRPVAEPLHLVCTHGRRDRCCAVRGMGVYVTMAACAEEAGRVWQASHVGGHRYAANVVSLPHGLYYGRVSPSDGERLLAAHDAGELFDPDRLRGRSCYDGPTQAAEIALLRELGWRALIGPRHLGTEEVDGGYEVRFQTPAGERTIRVRAEALAPRPGSCGDDPKPGSALRVVPA